MSLEELRRRYKHIAKESLAFLKRVGFEKKGKTFSKQNNELILEISASIPRPPFNSEGCFQFEVSFEVLTTNLDYIQAYGVTEKGQDLKKAPLMWNMVVPDNYTRSPMIYLSNVDSGELDEQLIQGIREKIEKEVLPWFNTVSSIQDIAQIAETEANMAREERKFFSRVNIYHILARLYAGLRQKEKCLEACDQSIEKIPVTARGLAEKDKKKYIKYFETLTPNRDL